MDLQEAFDKGTRGVIEQGAKCMNYSTSDLGMNTCVYTDKKGRHCLLGHLLIDPPGINSIANQWTVEKLALNTMYLAHIKVPIAKLEELQTLHDQAEGVRGKKFVESFKKSAREFAKRYDLKVWFDEEPVA